MADNGNWTGDIGCGVIGLDPDDNTLLGYQMWWPKAFITTSRDIKGKHPPSSPTDPGKIKKYPHTIFYGQYGLRVRKKVILGNGNS